MLDTKLYTLLAVAEKMNFTEAASALSLTQPAVSHQISALEKELGCKLFLRQRGRMILTEEGQLAVHYARRLESVYKNFQTALVDRTNRITRLRIGITHTSESNLIAEVLAQYGNENPNVLISVTTDSAENLCNMLEDYALDIAVIEGTHKASPSTSAILLDTDCLVCAVANENPLAKKSMVTLDELKKQKMIMRRPESGTVNLFAACLAGMNESMDAFNIIIEVDNIATIKDLIRLNFGISILPKSACMNEVLKGKMSVLPIENMSMTREMNIVYHRDFAHPDILKSITELYRKTSVSKFQPS